MGPAVGPASSQNFSFVKEQSLLPEFGKTSGSNCESWNFRSTDPNQERILALVQSIGSERN